MHVLKGNAVKLAATVVLLGAATVLFVVRSRGGPPARSAKVQYVCVATGQTFWFKRAPTILPRANPKTGERTLVPCHQNADGSLQVSRRQRSLIEQLERDGINKYVDPKTLLVRKSP